MLTAFALLLSVTAVLAFLNERFFRLPTTVGVTLAGALAAGALPVVPAKGSVGASGDLAPLAHMSAAMLGEGDVMLRGERVTAGEALRRMGLEAPRIAVAMIRRGRSTPPNRAMRPSPTSSRTASSARPRSRNVSACWVAAPPTVAVTPSGSARPATTPACWSRAPTTRSSWRGGSS